MSDTTGAIVAGVVFSAIVVAGVGWSYLGGSIFPRPRVRSDIADVVSHTLRPSPLSRNPNSFNRYNPRHSRHSSFSDDSYYSTKNRWGGKNTKNKTKKIKF